MAKRAKQELADDGTPEPSLIEVQRMLEEGVPIGTPVAIAPDPIALSIAPIDAGALHALDLAAINSKIVVLEEHRGAVLATPNGPPALLPVGDPAHKLAGGARIRKVAEDRYVGEQLSPTVSREPLIRDTASAVIAEFNAHFHG